VVPERVVDAQSLVAFADLVISAGGTMNREAVALGTPVYTTFEGRLGGVDEQLLAEGRLRRLSDPGELELGRRSGSPTERVRRDPAVYAGMMLAPVGGLPRPG
jgi:predicted glycosyltransferase